MSEQRPPTPNDGPHIKDRVVADIEALCERRRIKYGTHLQANNGRDALRDLYEELLDACLYIRQLMEERDVRIESATSA